MHLSDEDGRGWTVLAVDRATRRVGRRPGATAARSGRGGLLAALRGPVSAPWRCAAISSCAARPRRARRTRSSSSPACRAATTRPGPRSASVRTRAGGARWSTRCGPRPATGCSTSRRAPAWSPPRSCAATAAASSASTRASRCSPRRAHARRPNPRLAARIELVRGEAEALPFPDASFDALTFTYLLRYVDDPQGTLAELARVVAPGGRIASLEFGVPVARGAASPVAAVHARRPAGCRPPDLARVAQAVGRFLGPSIEALRARPSARAARPSAGSGRASSRCACGA